MFGFGIENCNGYMEVSIRHELDLSTDRLGRLHWAAVLAEEPEGLLVDLSRVTFLDCTGACFLVWAYTEAIKRRCACVLVTGANPRVHRVLKLLKWEARLPIYLTRASAIPAVQRIPSH
jgi:anti-anti-sigma factor